MGDLETGGDHHADPVGAGHTVSLVARPQSLAPQVSGGGYGASLYDSKLPSGKSSATDKVHANKYADEMFDPNLSVHGQLFQFFNCYNLSRAIKVDMTDGEISKVVEKLFDMRPYFIEQRLKLRTPIYSETAAYGHMGRHPEIKTVSFTNPMGETVSQEVETFTWEKLDYVDKVKEAFKL